MKTTFIYALSEPDVSGIKRVRYVGKSNNPTKRFREHLWNKTSRAHDHRSYWIQSLVNREAIPQLEILLEISEAEWPYWEIEMIKLFREAGCNLVNGTDGGDCPGALGHMKGKKRNLEAVKKSAAAQRGVKRTPEQRQRMSEAQTRHHLMHPEHREAIIKAQTGRKHSIYKILK